MLFTAFLVFIVAATNGLAKADEANFSPAHNTQLKEYASKYQTLAAALDQAEKCFTAVIDIALGIASEKDYPQYPTSARCKDFQKASDGNYTQLENVKLDGAVVDALPKVELPNVFKTSGRVDVYTRQLSQRRDKLKEMNKMAGKATAVRGVMIKYRNAVRILDSLINKTVRCYDEYQFDSRYSTDDGYKAHIKMCNEELDEFTKTENEAKKLATTITRDVLRRARQPDVSDMSGRHMSEESMAYQGRRKRLMYADWEAKELTPAISDYIALVNNLNYTKADAERCYRMFTHNETTKMDSQRAADDHLAECNGYRADAKASVKRADELLGTSFDLIPRLVQDGFPIIGTGKEAAARQDKVARQLMDFEELDRQAKVSDYVVTKMLPVFFGKVAEPMKKMVHGTVVQFVSYMLLTGSTKEEVVAALEVFKTTLINDMTAAMDSMPEKS